MSSVARVIDRVLEDMLGLEPDSVERCEILCALDAAGYVVMPKEATQPMVDAGVECRQHDGSITSIYCAMVAAAGSGE